MERGWDFDFLPLLLGCVDITIKIHAIMPVSAQCSLLCFIIWEHILYLQP